MRCFRYNLLLSVIFLILIGGRPTRVQAESIAYQIDIPAHTTSTVLLNVHTDVIPAFLPTVVSTSNDELHYEIHAISTPFQSKFSSANRTEASTLCLKIPPQTLYILNPAIRI